MAGSLTVFAYEKRRLCFWLLQCLPFGKSHTSVGGHCYVEARRIFGYAEEFAIVFPEEFRGRGVDCFASDSSHVTLEKDSSLFLSDSAAGEFL